MTTMWGLARAYEDLPRCAASFMCQRDGFPLGKRGVDSIEFIPLSFWYDVPLISRDSDRRHDPWLVDGLPSYSLARWRSWISPA